MQHTAIVSEGTRGVVDDIRRYGCVAKLLEMADSAPANFIHILCRDKLLIKGTEVIYSWILAETTTDKESLLPVLDTTCLKRPAC